MSMIIGKALIAGGVLLNDYSLSTPERTTSG
nr:MAG TPA: hypothetical protein [Caudoviricetes sp.]